MLSLSWTIVVYVLVLFFFVKQKTAYEMRISDWSSDVCSSDLDAGPCPVRHVGLERAAPALHPLARQPSDRIFDAGIRAIWPGHRIRRADDGRNARTVDHGAWHCVLCRLHVHPQFHRRRSYGLADAPLAALGRG